MSASRDGLFPKSSVSTSSLPQINIDDFDPKAMFIALRDFGTYEITGPSVNALRELAKKTLATAEKALKLPIEVLAKYDHQGQMHGFQNVKAKTLQDVAAGKAAVSREQIALHFNYYKNKTTPRVPEGIDGDIFEEYFKQAHQLLCKHYEQIAQAFIDDEFKSNINLSNDKQSVLMMRRYFAKSENSSNSSNQHEAKQSELKTTGIPPHSDHGLITLVTSDQPGLEVLKGDKWISAPHTAGELRFCINFADWALFQIWNSRKKDENKFGANNFKEGLHRVPHVNQERYSLILAFNPDLDEKILTPKGKIASYREFLYGKKSDFRDTSRDDSANTLSNQLDSLVPINPISVPENTPKLYVIEKSLNGQDPWIFVHGSSETLCDKIAGQDIPVKAHEKFSYAYPSVKDAKESCLSTHDQGMRAFEVTLNCANDIYVVDESVASSSDANSKIKIAKTLVPLNDYKNNYQSPVYLIQRPLGIKETKEITYAQENTFSFKS